MRRLTNEEEDLIFEAKPKLFSIGIITLSKEIISLLSVGVLVIRSTEEYNSKQKTSYQTTTKAVPSIIKSEDFCARPEVSLKNQGLSRNLLPS
jgi:hypothetical protein